jgi:stalled ribosome rescue protein Dom34
LESEKGKYKQVFKELETKLRVEMDSFELEKEQWKDKSLEMLKRIAGIFHYLPSYAPYIYITFYSPYAYLNISELTNVMLG